MRGTLAVAAREIERRWVLLAAALAAGLLPFTAPLVRSGTAAAEWRDAMAGLLAVGVGLGTALFLGASVVGRDLAEGRLSFDFVRPLGASAVWAGRLAAALALCVGATVLTLLPTAVLGHGIVSPEVRPLVDDTAPRVIAALFLLIPLGHALSVMVRSRSAWLVVDVGAAVAVALSIAVTKRRLLAGLPWGLFPYLVATLVPLAIVIFWVASGVGVGRGRTDLQRSHRALSLALWIPLAALALGFAGYAGWVVSAAPGDLEETWGYGATTGNWAVVYGSSPGRGYYCPAFLVDLSSGRFEVLGASPRIAARATFSGDGRRVVWLQPDAEELAVYSLDLATPGAAPGPTRVGLPHSDVFLFLSEQGERLAALDGDRLTVYELDSGRILTALRLPGESCSIAFTGADRVRAACFAPKLTIGELDLAARRFEVTGGADIQSGFATWTPDRGRLVVQGTHDPSGFSLLDGRTGALLARIPLADVRSYRSRRLLADGRFVIAGSAPTGGSLRVYSRDGVEERTLELPFPIQVVGGEVARGRLAIITGRRAQPGGEVVLVDLASGDTQVVGRERWPLIEPSAGFTFAAPGSAATRLFVSDDSLVALDPATATWTPVAGPEVAD